MDKRLNYTDDQFKELSAALPHFESARHDYIRDVPRWLTEKVIKIYEDATGKTVPSKNTSCAVCVLRVYQLVGRTYFDDKKEREKISNEGNAKDNNTETDFSKSNSGDKEKNKRGSKKDTKCSKQD